mmetsp:Transcript_77228/g.250009  ORF Transcript_77228/g.250009 Transcript_77228/m.250009 type:complete len:294 (+) Transcript_77228:539-1420(+)
MVGRRGARLATVAFSVCRGGLRRRLCRRTLRDRLRRQCRRRRRHWRRRRRRRGAGAGGGGGDRGRSRRRGQRQRLLPGGELGGGGADGGLGPDVGASLGRRVGGRGRGPSARRRGPVLQQHRPTALLDGRPCCRGRWRQCRSRREIAPWVSWRWRSGKQRRSCGFALGQGCSCGVSSFSRRERPRGWCWVTAASSWRFRGRERAGASAGADGSKSTSSLFRRCLPEQAQRARLGAADREDALADGRAPGRLQRHGRGLFGAGPGPEVQTRRRLRVPRPAREAGVPRRTIFSRP